MSATILAAWMALQAVVGPSGWAATHDAWGLERSDGVALQAIDPDGESDPRFVNRGEFAATMTHLLEGRGPLADVALWFATARVQLDVAQDRFFVTLRVDEL